MIDNENRSARPQKTRICVFPREPSAVGLSWRIQACELSVL